MESKKIFVWIKEPGRDAKHVWISNSLENLQKIVGGYIENWQWASNEAVICNEEGLPLGLPYNCRVLNQDFYGTIIFAGTENAEYVDSQLSMKLLEGMIK